MHPNGTLRNTQPSSNPQKEGKERVTFQQQETPEF